MNLSLPVYWYITWKTIKVVNATLTLPFGLNTLYLSMDPQRWITNDFINRCHRVFVLWRFKACSRVCQGVYNFNNCIIRFCLFLAYILLALSMPLFSVCRAMKIKAKNNGGWKRQISWSKGLYRTFIPHKTYLFTKFKKKLFCTLWYKLNLF